MTERVRIVHTTRFSFDAPVRELALETHLTPFETEHHQLITKPRSERTATTDAFGNLVWRATIEGAPTRLELSTVSTVVRRAEGQGGGDASLGEAHIAEADTSWTRASKYAPIDEDLASFAARALAPGPLREAVLRLAKAIHEKLRYRHGERGVQTAPEVLRRGEGVCQDFAHVAISCLRSSDLPARYVAGYLIDGTSARGMHAWASVRSASGQWIDFDPTLGGLCDHRHIPVAIGRDYDDVPPIRGALGVVRRQRTEVDVRFIPA